MNATTLSFAQALADETRQQIMLHLCCVWLSVNDVVDKLEGQVKQPTVSHHLKILEAANLVSVRQEGRQRFYTLNEDYFTVCCGQLMQSFAPSFNANFIPLASLNPPED
jgi:ArsR family transcriptional regulator, arsenate/arsenite/antimonite-responsive transcriptional repressor